jgi:hypothetical protein
VLTINLERDGNTVRNVTMTGPAKTVFTGSVEI